MLGVALASLVAWALFSEGATSLENEAGLQIALCAAALVTLAGLLFSPRVRLRAPLAALVGLGMLVLFAAWAGFSIDWSIAPDLSWVQLNRWAAYALVAALALVLGSSLAAPRGGRRSRSSRSPPSSRAYALGGKVAPWLSIPGLIDLDHTDDFSRLRAPLGYWNALGARVRARRADRRPRWRRPRRVPAAAHVLRRGARPAPGHARAHLLARRDPRPARRARGCSSRSAPTACGSRPTACSARRRRARLSRGRRARRPDDGRPWRAPSAPTTA